jgi:hypothetical protein
MKMQEQTEREDKLSKLIFELGGEVTKISNTDLSDIELMLQGHTEATKRETDTLITDTFQIRVIRNGREERSVTLLYSYPVLHAPIPEHRWIEPRINVVLRTREPFGPQEVKSCRTGIFTVESLVNFIAGKCAYDGTPLEKHHEQDGQPVTT